MDKARITGFGSNGAKKTWTCPSGHMLQPWKAVPGSCDGCGSKIHKGDCVMDCRQCNYYLCGTCHPQEREQEDWFWGSLDYLAKATTQEMGEIASEFNEMAGDFETFMADMSPFSMCDAPQVEKKDELSIGQLDKKDTSKGSPYKKVKQNRPEEEEVVPASRTGGSDESQGKKEQRKKGVRAKSKEAPAPPAEEAPAPSTGEAKLAEEEEFVAKAARSMEDLLDIGQFDLLDLDVEPTPMERQQHLDGVAVVLPDLLMDLDASFAAVSPAELSFATFSAPELAASAAGPTAFSAPALNWGLAPPPAPKAPLQYA